MSPDPTHVMPPTCHVPPTGRDATPTKDPTLPDVSPPPSDATPKNKPDAPADTKHAPAKLKEGPSKAAPTAAPPGKKSNRPRLRPVEELEKEAASHPGRHAAPGCWVRSLGHLETLMAVGGRLGSMNTAQSLWLSSTEPITPATLKESIRDVAERNYMLQLVVVWRGARPWFKRMERLEVDFEVVEGDPQTVLEQLIHMPYQLTKGPLWRVRLVPLTPDSGGGPQGMGDTSPYQAAMVMSAHHVITDALTNMVFCRDVLRVFNARLTGAAVEVETRYVVPAFSDSLLSSTDWVFAGKYFWHKFIKCFLTSYNSKAYFHGVLPQPRTQALTTRLLHDALTHDLTTKLVRACKEHGVTVHAAVTAVAHMALFRVAQQRATAGMNQAVVNVSNCVNMRRYFPASLKETPGCHVVLEEKETLVSDADGASVEDLWGLAKRLHRDLHEALTVTHTPARRTPVYIPFTTFLCLNYHLTQRQRKNRTDCHIVTTNMGNLTHLLPDTYQGPVRVTSLLRTATSELTGHPVCLTFQSFRGQLLLSLDYFTNKTTQDVAEDLFTTLMHDLRALVSPAAALRHMT